jgi:hypothetical protein
MNLPQELLDEIISHLSPLDKESLKSCCLVSKSWVEPCQRLLFKNIRLRLDNYQRWKDAISPANVTLLRHLCSLTNSPSAIARRVADPCLSLFALRDYLPSFSQLRTLNLCSIDIQPTISEHLELLTAFQHTLVSLSLDSVSTAWSSFVVLIGHFPNLRNLELIDIRFQADDLPVPDAVHAGRGRLCVGLMGDVDVLCDRLAELKAEYNELELIGAYEHQLVAAVERSLECLSFNRCDCTWAYYMRSIPAA